MGCSCRFRSGKGITYAPLLARLGMDQWTPDLIWFSGIRVVRTPNYYVQQIFPNPWGITSSKAPCWMKMARL